MARLGCSIACRDCKEPLLFKENIDPVTFVSAILQFYLDHNKCEELALLKEKHEQELKALQEAKECPSVNPTQDSVDTPPLDKEPPKQ